MVARKMSTTQTTVAKSHPSPANAQSRVDRFLMIQLMKLQLRRRVSQPQVLVPRMDLYQDESLPSAYALFEVPGIAKESLKVIIMNSTLTIEGVRDSPLRTRLNEILQSRLASSDKEGRSVPLFTLSDEKYRGRELNFGIFCRQVQLPPGTQARDVRHELKDGMLLVTWPCPKFPTTDMPSSPISTTKTVSVSA